MQSSFDRGPNDAAINRVGKTQYGPVYCGIAYNEFFAGRQVNVNGVVPNLAFISPGELVCLSANFQQPNGPNFCGVIGTASDPMVRGMVRVNGFDACGGDSGGGWYWLTPNGRRFAYGLHSRSDFGCHGSLGGSRSWFSAMPMIKAFYTPTLNLEVRP
jgi:streptogrisin C